jgi:hypothetical protein
LPHRPQSISPSPALLAAQERLLKLRAESRAQRAALGLPLVTGGSAAVAAEHGRFPPPIDPNQTRPAVSLCLPAHLGWGSEPLTAVMRSLLDKNEERQAEVAEFRAVDPGSSVSQDEQIDRPAPTQPPTAVSLLVYPDMALAILRQEQTGAARVWYLLRHVDDDGRGWLEETAVRHHLTGRESPLRLCGQRQLRNLLDQGDGLYWERRNGRLWLRGLAKVAAALGVIRMQGRPVAVPLSRFTAGIGTFRAHLYATFHSGRGNPEKTAGPIARETLANLSHVPPRTQRLYEAKAGVEKETNYALGQRVSPQAAQELGWQKGQALFEFTDHQGQHGPVGATYLAWQLPNSYRGPHPQQKNGRQQRLNQAIADLLPIGMTGNGNTQAEPQRQRRYCPHGKMAARLYNRSSTDFYWPAPASCVWYLLSNGVNR